MHNLAPHFILEQFVRGQFNGRFQAATLFIDISGFTATSNIFMQQSMTGGEAMADVMQSIFDPLVEAVYAQGGFISGFAGDAFTAIFPRISGDSANFSIAPESLSSQPTTLRALAAGIAIQQIMQQRPTRQTVHGLFTFAIKIGLAVGEVEWGIIGEQEFEDMQHLGQLNHAYYFRGPAIDECGMGEQVAQKNDLIISEKLRQQLGTQVTVEVVVEDYWRVTAVHIPLPPPQPTYAVPIDHDLLTTFVPRSILQQPMRGEYRHVITLFLQLQDVESNAQLNAFVQNVYALQTRYGGYLNTVHFGDKGCNLLLFWGMPTSYENDIERVLGFVLQLREQTAVPFRAGISYRLMYAGFVGSSSLRQEYSCYGRGVNLASRLMTNAPWGQIWLDKNVAERASSAFIVEQQGRFTFKGFPEPLPVYALLNRRASTRVLYQGRMVARQRELARLAAWVHPVENGRFAGVLLIRGEAGIGKSRLISEFRTQINRGPAHDTSHWQWFTCQTDEILHQSFSPFRQLLREYFQQDATHTLAQNLTYFTNKFDDLLTSVPNSAKREELNQLRSCLQSLLDLPIHDPAYEQTSTDSRFINTLLALQMLLIAESQRQPLVLHIEDVHWLDQESWQFLKQFVQAAANYPIAILLTGRTDLIPPHFALDDVVSDIIDLNPLSKAGLAELAASTLGHAPTPELVQLLVERSDGNPFFAEQILLYLSEQNQLDQAVTPGRTTPLIPADVRAILVARLDRLSQDVKEVVQQAAVLGREFDVQLLATMLQRDKNLLAHIQDAERAAIWVAVSQLRYLFKHALLRDAAYDMQLHARRRELHLAAAQALEKLYTAEMATHLGELAYHYGQAGNWQKERHYAMQAGVQAAGVFAHTEAEHYLSRALDLTEPEDAETQYTLLLHLEGVHDIQGKRAEQETDLEALFALVARLQDDEKTAVAYGRQAHYANYTSKYPLAAEAAEKCVKLSKTEQTTATGYLAWGRAMWRQGHFQEAQDLIAEAWQRYKTLDDQEGLGITLNDAGIVAHRLGELGGSRACYKQALTIFRATGNRDRLARVLANTGNLHYMIGEYSQAFEYYQESLAIWQQHGNQQGMGVALLNLSVALRDMGDFMQAQWYVGRALSTSRQVEERTMEAAVLVNLTLLHHQLGEQETAVAYGLRAIAMLKEVKAPHFEAWAHTWLAHAFVALGRFDDATSHYHKALAIRRELKQETMHLEPTAGLARIALAQQNASQIREYSEAIWQATQKDPNLPDTHERIRVYLTGFRCFQAVEDGRAAELLAAGHKLLMKMANLITRDEQRQSFLDAIPAHREMLTIWNDTAD